MAEGRLDPPVFEISKSSIDVSLTQTPYFYNDNGSPVYLAALPEGVEPLAPARTNPLQAIGRGRYRGGAAPTTTPESESCAGWLVRMASRRKLHARPKAITKAKRLGRLGPPRGEPQSIRCKEPSSRST